jgi:hypothetical protein
MCYHIELDHPELLHNKNWDFVYQVSEDECYELVKNCLESKETAYWDTPKGWRYPIDFSNSDIGAEQS